jgi:hypothetical protein
MEFSMHELIVSKCGAAATNTIIQTLQGIAAITIFFRNLHDNFYVSIPRLALKLKCLLISLSMKTFFE